MEYIIEADSVLTTAGADGLNAWIVARPPLAGAAVARLIELAVEVGDTGDRDGEAGNLVLADALAAADSLQSPDSAAPRLVEEYRGWDGRAREERARARAAEDDAWAITSADPDSALAVFRAVDAVYERLPDSHSRARVHGRMGAAHWYRGDADAVEEHYREALRRRRMVQDRMLEAATLNGLGSLHYRLEGDLEAASRWYAEAIELRGAIGDQSGLGTSLTYAANVESALGNLLRARSLYEQALPILERTGSTRQVVENLAGTAGLYQTMARPADAMRLYSAAIELCAEDEECAYVPLLLVELAAVEQSVGRLQDCLASLQRAEDLGPDPETAARIWQVRAQASAELGDANAARDQMVRAIALSRESGNAPLECDARILLSHLYTKLGALDRATATAREALDLARELGSRQLERGALFALGYPEVESGNGSAAAGHYTAALEIDRELGDRLRSADDLIGRGGAYSLIGEVEKARTDLRKAIAIYRETGGRSGEWVALQNLADSFEETHPDSAAWYYDAALASLEERSGVDAGEALNTGYLFANRGAAYEEIARYYVRRHREDPKGGWIDRAFRTVERSRARGLLDLLENSFALDAGPEALALIDELHTLDVATPEGRARRDRIRARLAELRAAQRPTAARGLDPVGLRPLLADKPGQTLILQYAIGDSSTLLFAIDNKAAIVHELPGREELRRRVTSFRDAIAQPGAADQVLLEEGYALYRMLIAPVEERVNRRKDLVIVPDGILFELPFEALLDEPGRVGAPWSEQPFFGRKNRPVYAPSSTVYLELREQKAGDFDRELLAVGAVDYTGLDRALDPLPNTLSEVERIHDGLKPKEHHQLLAGDATENSVRTALRFGSWRVVHLATHGLIDAGEPMRSCVALGADATYDGYLSALEILTLSLDRPLVVLSACESARGKLERGEGVVGLTRSFLASGARGVVASLWPVADESTAELMSEFYAALWKKYSAAESLRQARNALLQHEEWGHPYYWAAFVTVGAEKAPW